MRKILMICLLALFAVSAVWADVIPSDRPVRRGAEGAVIPDMPGRAGTCQLRQAGTSYWGSFGWADGMAYAQYLRPATSDDYLDTCTPSEFPFHVTSIEVILDLGLPGDFAAEVGYTVTFNALVAFPEDLDPCKGVGAAVASAVGTYTVTAADAAAGGFVIVSVPIDVCVNANFFVVAEFVSYDGNPGWAVAPSSDLGNVVACNSWIRGLFGNGQDWWANSKDWTSGGNFVGPWTLRATGEAGASCETVYAPQACTRITGDTYANPIDVTWTSNSWIFDLCDFCPDYVMTTETGGAYGSNTSAANDLVLHWVDANPAEADFCFNVGIYPTEGCDLGSLRLRSWLISFDGSGYYLGNGDPGNGAGVNSACIWPNGFGESIQHDYSGSGLGCDLGCMQYGQYEFWLVIDARNDYCCPLRVRMFNDEILPVELMSFGVDAGDGRVSLNWTTRSESGIDHYGIIRNGEILAEVAGQGDSETGHHYSYVDNDVVNGETYSYQLVSYTIDGGMIVSSTTVSATPVSGVVTEYALMQNYPNPFNPTTNIAYTLLDAGYVTMKVYSIDGREVATLVNGNVEAGSHNVEFDASGLASGMYLYKMDVNGFSASQKMVLMK